MPSFSALKSFSCFRTLFSPHSRNEAIPNANNQIKSSQASSTIELILPPLRPSILPHVIPLHQPSLSSQGWTTITHPTPTDPLHTASLALFAASKNFFALPISEKEKYLTKAGTEEGWARVEGEKEFITLRSLSSTPPELRNAAIEYWALTGKLLNETLGRVAESLGLDANELQRFSEPCAALGTDSTATMVRIFRYEGFEGGHSKIVSEPHKDLGLLSLVIGDTPGLEAWDRNISSWFPIERTYTQPAGTLLVGKQLERLSNGRYSAGGHLVRSYPDLASKEKYRYSIVFVLRAHSPLLVNTDRLTSSITGEFQNPIRDVKARELYLQIQKAHFNINTGHDEREQQRIKLAAMKSTNAIPLQGSN